MPRAPSRTFVGRAEELGALAEGFERARASEPLAFVVGGEAGVGKTRLVGELARRAEASGAQVMSGGCIELTGGVAPLLPIVEALRGVSDRIGWADWLALVGDS